MYLDEFGCCGDTCGDVCWEYNVVKEEESKSEWSEVNWNLELEIKRTEERKMRTGWNRHEETYFLHNILVHTIGNQKTRDGSWNLYKNIIIIIIQHIHYHYYYIIITTSLDTFHFQWFSSIFLGINTIGLLVGMAIDNMMCILCACIVYCIYC